MSTSYAALQKQIAELQSQAEAQRKSEVADVVARIKESIATYGLSAKDLGFNASGLAPAKAVRAGAGVAKYRDPKTGKTWTGHGKPPQWLAGKRNRDDFLINKPAEVATAPAPAKAAKPAKPAKAATPGKTTAAPAAKKSSGKSATSKPAAPAKKAAPVKTTAKASAKAAAKSPTKASAKKAVTVKPAAPAAPVKHATEDAAPPADAAVTTA